MNELEEVRARRSRSLCPHKPVASAGESDSRRSARCRAANSPGWPVNLIVFATSARLSGRAV